MTCGTLTTVDILPAASGEDSYGVGGCSDLFGGFLSQPPYFGGGQRRGFTFGLSSHRSGGQKEYRAVGRKKERWALYPRPERRGFTAPLVKLVDPSFRDPTLNITVDPSLAPEEQTHTAAVGDSLSKIPMQFYGNPNSYMKIFEANKDKLQRSQRDQGGTAAG